MDRSATGMRNLDTENFVLKNFYISTFFHHKKLKILHNFHSYILPLFIIFNQIFFPFFTIFSHQNSPSCINQISNLNPTHNLIFYTSLLLPLTKKVYPVGIQKNPTEALKQLKNPYYTNTKFLSHH